MTRLAARLGIGAAKESVVRQVITAAGVALGVALLLFAGVAFPALHAHDVRGGWLTTRAHNSRPAQDESTTDPLLWKASQDRFEGRTIERIDEAALGPKSPVPPGLTALPGPGQLAMSPALQRLVQRSPADLLGDRFPGTVVATIGHDGLESPNDLIVVVGHAADEIAGQADVDTVHSIEAKPVSHSETRLTRVVLFVGGMGLLAPIIVFVATATRLGALRREQRLAALRLAGATPGQTNLIAAFEAALAAVAGVVLGFVVFLIGKPHIAGIPFDGRTFYPSDLRLSPVIGVVVAVGVPALAVGAALLSLRRVRVSPLGVSRAAFPPKPRARRLVVLAAGLGLFFATLVWSSRYRGGGLAPVLAVAGAFAVIILGVVAAGPWITSVVARLLGRLSGRPSVVLASRRLQHNPRAAFRAIGGLTLAVFMSTVFSGLASSILAENKVKFKLDRFPPDMLTTVTVPFVGGIPAGRANPVLDELQAAPGVTRVVTLRAVPPDVTVTSGLPNLFRPDGDGKLLQVGGAVADCSAADVLGLPPCQGTLSVSRLLARETTPITLSRPVAPSELAAQPLVAIGVGTDGRPESIERARTLIAGLAPGTSATTSLEDAADDAQTIHTIQRMSNAGLGIVLVVAGCSLAVAVADGLIERKRPFSLLRLSGMRPAELHRIVLTEAGGPLLAVAAASVVVGFVVAAMVLSVVGAHTWRAPSVGYWLALTGGVTGAMAIVASTFPLLNRLTSLESARFE